MEWPHERTLKFIECYKSYSLLWDRNHEFYKYRIKRHDALAEIAAKFGTQTPEVERKIKNLQSHFLREQKRIHMRKVKDSIWFAYKPLMFLSTRYKPPRMNSALKAKSNRRKEIENSTNFNREERRSEAQKCQSCQNARTNDVTSAAVIKEAFQWFRERDEFDLFGAQVAIKLRNIQSSYARVSLQNKMNTLLMEAELGMYDEDALPQNPPIEVNVPDMFFVKNENQNI